uniref:Uncharacterized protein n=1 Tax=Knipowitschia caucasica TaxID=637954 RepID=A0AAV2J286_KNICA
MQGKKNNNPAYPDYTPSIFPQAVLKELTKSTTLDRFKRAQKRKAPSTTLVSRKERKTETDGAFFSPPAPEHCFEVTIGHTLRGRTSSYYVHVTKCQALDRNQNVAVKIMKDHNLIESMKAKIGLFHYGGNEFSNSSAETARVPYKKKLSRFPGQSVIYSYTKHVSSHVPSSASMFSLPFTSP